MAHVGLSEFEARKAGYEIITCLTPGQDHATYYPGYREIVVKLIVDKNTGKILGGQVVGPGEAAKRAVVLATAITFGLQFMTWLISTWLYARRLIVQWTHYIMLQM
jgi:pyruvate/2-oxoglutarate dehydrogenase complex dihydrolipoamide dehydrogenase (E3) component